MFVHSGTEALPRRLVVLGGTGFVGRAVVERALQKSVNVLSLGSRDVDLGAPDAQTKLKAILSDGDSVLFLSEIGRSGFRSGSEALRLNLLMAQTLATISQERTLAHLIYVSTDGVYPFVDGFTNEDTAAAPDSFYALMHRSRELVFQFESKAPLAVLRLTGTYGPGDVRGAYGPNRFVRQAVELGQIRVAGSGAELRDHIFVEDAASLILATALRRSCGVLNLCSGQSVDFRRLAETVARLTSAVIVSEEARRPVTHRRFDVARRLEAFPDFSPLNLENGLMRTLESCRATA